MPTTNEVNFEASQPDPNLAVSRSADSSKGGNVTEAESQAEIVRNLGLPLAQEFPERMVVIFDGNCRFCQLQVKRLKSFDRSNSLSFVSLHDPFVKANYSDLSHDQLMDQMYVVTPDGMKFGGAEAIKFLSRKIYTLWPIMPFLHIPFTLWFWQAGYNAIAKRRYKISQKLAGNDECAGACEIHFRK